MRRIILIMFFCFSINLLYAQGENKEKSCYFSINTFWSESISENRFDNSIGPSIYFKNKKTIIGMGLLYNFKRHVWYEKVTINQYQKVKSIKLHLPINIDYAFLTCKRIDLLARGGVMFENSNPGSGGKAINLSIFSGIGVDYSLYKNIKIEAIPFLKISSNESFYGVALSILI